MASLLIRAAHLITDVENGGIARMSPDGKLQTLTKSDKVTWADGIVMTPDGRALFTDSAIPAYLDPLARPPSAERLKAAAPYTIYQFRP
jgi:sugar lactone lactonase YvrE